MTTLTTHDTKRTEDVRARLLVLAEIPGKWARAVLHWRAAASKYGALDENTDYLFWQTLVGAWPLTAERMSAYLEKATREAKTHTSWVDPDDAYDATVRRFTEGVFADQDLMQQVGGWCAEHVDEPGRANALAQKLLQLTMPGVPDVYQGQELPAPALVDPDNRRPVDYDIRRSMLATLDHFGGAPTTFPPDLSDSVVAGYPKLLVTARTLRLRRERPESFAGSYTPLTIDGNAANHTIGYLRGDDVAVIVTRLPVGLACDGGFGNTAVTLPAGAWREVLTGRVHNGTIRLADVTETLPVALLARDVG